MAHHTPKSRKGPVDGENQADVNGAKMSPGQVGFKLLNPHITNWLWLVFVTTKANSAATAADSLSA